MSDQRQPESPTTVHRHLKDREGLCGAALELVAHARRELVLCSAALDPAIFSRAALAESLGHFIARQTQCRARIVVEDTEHLLQSNARLVELARRFSDLIFIQRLGEAHHGLTEMFMVADSESCLVQPDITVIDATLDLQTPHLAVPLARRFDTIWDASEPVPGLHGFRL